MTNRFLLTYRSGATEEVVTDAETAADQCMRTFGLTPEEAAEFGAAVELLGPYAATEAATEDSGSTDSANTEGSGTPQA